MASPISAGAILSWVGLLLMIFAVVDLICANGFGIDLTGVSWSPIAAGIGGNVLYRMSSSN
jgi:hypothetical protein